MIREHDIKWFLTDPNRLLYMKPFTRGGTMKGHGFEGNKVLNNTLINTGFSNLELVPISQDTYITEYRPDLHHIKLNESFPHIQVRIDGQPLNFGMLDLTQTASFQKLIHSAHVRSLTANPLRFTLGKRDSDNGGVNKFDTVKDEWLARDMDWWLAQAINTCKQLGNCGLLFSYDKVSNRVVVTNYSYEDGYQIIPNYDEYGIEIARSLSYQLDDKVVIETYDSKYHYHIVQGVNGWEIEREVHGFSRCPLLHKRGKVAWEYAESSIEIWELMVNIQNTALKRFGTFALVFTGEMDADSFKRDSSTLIINLSSDTTNGKQSADVLNFPEPQTMDKYLKTVEEKISLFSSTSFITPKDIQNTGSGGNGIALAMSNDYALATQSAMDWRRFVNEMVYLHQEGLDLEEGENYADLHVSAKIVPWAIETNSTKITNLAMESKWLSKRTIIEESPDAAPDELERLEEEGRSTDDVSDEDAEKARRVSINNNSTIVDNVKKQNVETEGEDG